MKTLCAMLALLIGTSLLPSNTALAQSAKGKEMDMTHFAIEKLHQEDIAATVSMNVDQLVALWADDGVLVAQGDNPIVGKKAIEDMLRKNFAKNPSTKVLKYEPQIVDLQVSGDVAYEWGRFSVTQQGSPDGKPMNFEGRFLRILRKQADGSWKFVRVMWNTGRQ